LAAFSSLQATGLRIMFLAGCELEAALSSLPHSPLHRQLTTWQFASPKPARREYPHKMGITI